MTLPPRLPLSPRQAPTQPSGQMRNAFDRGVSGRGFPTPIPSRARGRGPLILLAIVIAVCTVVGGLAWLDRDALPDRLTTMFTEPDPAVTQLANRVQLTDRARLRLDATKPELLEAESFGQACPGDDESSAVLGCYTSDDRIHISNITDPRFDGIREVTLAHEILHAFWSRYDQKIRGQLSDELEQAYERVATPESDERLASYEVSEPGQRANELHSILGTEIADLSPELEQHYASVFTDRSTVVQLHQQYQTVFDENQRQLNALESSILAGRQALEARSSTHEQALSDFETDQQALETRRSSIDRTSAAQVNAFNADLARLRDRQQQINAEADAINADAASLNADIDRYNELVGSRRELYASITAGR